MFSAETFTLRLDFALIDVRSSINAKYLLLKNSKIIFKKGQAILVRCIQYIACSDVLLIMTYIH